MSNTTHKSNKTHSLKTLFKEAFLSIFLPHKTFRRIPKNPRLNYRQIIPLLFLSGFPFWFIHMSVVYHKIFFVLDPIGAAFLIAAPFFSIGIWLLGTLSFYYIARVFKKDVPIQKIEVAVFYLWLAWLLIPAFDLLHPLFGIPIPLAFVWGIPMRISWLFAFPVLATETFFLLKDLLKLAGKKIIISLIVALTAPILGRFFLEQVPDLANRLLGIFTPAPGPSYFFILLTPALCGLVFSIWLFQKGKYTTFRFLRQTVVICLMLTTASTLIITFAPLPVPTPTLMPAVTKTGPFGPGRDHVTHSHTWTSSDLESGTVLDDATVYGPQWWQTQYNSIAVGFNTSQSTVSEIRIAVHLTSSTADSLASDGYPKLEACFSGNGSTFYCSPFLTNIPSGANTDTFTINSGSIYQYVVGGAGSALTSTDWNTLVASISGSNSVIIQAATTCYIPGTAGCTSFDMVDFDSVTVAIDYKVNMRMLFWHWYENINDQTPTTPLGGLDDPPTANIHRNSVIRLRIDVVPSPSTLDQFEQTFKLQYAQMAGGDCTFANQTWVDVGSSASTTAAWRGYVNNKVTNSSTLTTQLLPASVLESYQDNNPSRTNPNSLGAYDDSEWDWVIQNYLAAFNTNYCFRMAAAVDPNNITGPYGGNLTYIPWLTTANDIVLKGKINLRGLINIK